jgi:tRNA threonylcarbamoyladenosine biosynthesis protein TsaB
MTSFLTIETSTPACSVALQVDGVLRYRYSVQPRSHTKLVMTMVNELLGEAGLTVADLEAIGVTVGPGSFTGLRIGFATVQGLAFAADLPVVAVSTLQTIVATYWRGQVEPCHDQEKPIVAVLDARMGEYNIGCYLLSADGQIRVQADDQLLSGDQALAFIAEHQPEAIVGDPGQLLAAESSWREKLVEVFPSAVDLVAVTATAYAAGRAQPAESIELVYLRGTEAWQKRKRLRKV